jgi:hypothetical protein
VISLLFQGYLQMANSNRGRHVLFVFGFLLASQLLFAQGDGGGGDPDVPIDGGLGILLAAGVTYGVKRIVTSSKEASFDEQE